MLLNALHTQIHWDKLTFPKIGRGGEAIHNLDRPKGYYFKRKKLSRERHIPNDFTYMWNRKNKSSRNMNWFSGCKRGRG